MCKVIIPPDIKTAALMSRTGESSTSTGSMELDLSRNYMYSTNQEEIKLHRFSPGYAGENADVPLELAYISKIPIVRTWTQEVVKPDNLLLYNGGNAMLLSDARAYDAILNLDIERGVVTSKKDVHKSFGGRQSEDVKFKVNRFDYNAQGEYAQFDKCVIGVNSNHIMRFDVGSGTVVHHKAYERNPGFTSVATDAQGTIIVGDREGGLRVFADVGKRAIKAIPGLGDPITHVHISSAGDVLATTDLYFILLPRFMYMDEKGLLVSKLPVELRRYLGIEGVKIVKAQFSGDEQSAVFSVGKYIMHQSLADIMNQVQEYRVYEADGKVVAHKFSGSSQFALSENKPIRFQV